jgi:hypothetical protein
VFAQAFGLGVFAEELPSVISIRHGDRVVKLADIAQGCGISEKITQQRGGAEFSQRRLAASQFLVGLHDLRCETTGIDEEN